MLVAGLGGARGCLEGVFWADFRSLPPLSWQCFQYRGGGGDSYIVVLDSRMMVMVIYQCLDNLRINVLLPHITISSSTKQS